MERDFLGMASKLSSRITVKEETNQDLAPSRGMMEWPFSSQNCSSAPQILSFGAFSDQDRRIKSVNDRLLPSVSFTPTSVAYKNQRTHYSQQEQTTITASICEPRGKSFKNSFANHQYLGGSHIMTPPVSVFPGPCLTVETTDVRSSSKRIGSPSSQLTIFYAGAVSVYKDISPEKAHAIMLLARDGPQDKPVPMPRPQKPVHHPFAVVTDHSKTGSGTTGLRVTKTMTSLASTHTDASNMASPVGLRQTRKASLARFLEKRKERVINFSPYYVENKSSTDSRTPMS
ncbi:protein TIFY 6A isoform X2 [Capsella rubella]|uniref:protein TIFY 6A isoform X2 n=1 Tax=Capsella rubella TaxID=81985 RepID=UPI000CD5B68A|nr:protein TIFY 6A isoform X2 [Capsella rubella]